MKTAFQRPCDKSFVDHFDNVDEVLKGYLLVGGHRLYLEELD